MPPDKTTLEILKERGTKRCIIAYDADRYHNSAVMMFMNNLAELLNSNNFDVFIADWNENDGKGLDDLLSAGKLPQIYQHN